MKFNTLCRWVCSVPVRITRNFPSLPVLLIKDVLVQRINFTVASHIASLIAQRSLFGPFTCPLICPITHLTAISPWAVLTGPLQLSPQPFYPSGSTINTLITPTTNHLDPTRLSAIYSPASRISNIPDHGSHCSHIRL